MLDCSTPIQIKTDKIANDAQGNGRTTPRRCDDLCAFSLNGSLHPVVDWSESGILISGDSKTFTVGQSYDFVLKFKLHDRIVELPHRGRVARKTSQSIAFHFEPLSAGENSKIHSLMKYQDTRQRVSDRPDNSVY